MNKPTIAQLAAYGGALTITIGEISQEVTTLNHFLKFHSFNIIEEALKVEVIKIHPHLRSMKNLDKPIVVEGYNDNEPFVPFEKLYLKSYSMEEIFANYYETEAFKTGDGKIEYDRLNYIFFNEEVILELDFNHYDLLNLWQFDYRGWIDAGYAKELKD